MVARMEDGVLDLIAVHVSTDLLALSVKEVKEINMEGNYEQLYATIQYVHILCCVFSGWASKLPVNRLLFVILGSVFLFSLVATFQIGKYKAVAIGRNLS